MNYRGFDFEFGTRWNNFGWFHFIFNICFYSKNLQRYPNFCFKMILAQKPWTCNAFQNAILLIIFISSLSLSLISPQRSFLDKKASRAPTFLFFHPFSCPSTDTISGYRFARKWHLKKEREKKKKKKCRRVHSSRPRLSLNICSLLRVSTFCRFVFAKKMDVRRSYSSQSEGE